MIALLPNSLEYDNSLREHKQSKETQDWLYTLMETEPERTFEEINDGKGNKRVLTEIWKVDDIVITKTYQYNFPLPSKAWGGLNDVIITVSNGK